MWFESSHGRVQQYFLNSYREELNISPLAMALKTFVRAPRPILLRSINSLEAIRRVKSPDQPVVSRLKSLTVTLTLITAAPTAP